MNFFIVTFSFAALLFIVWLLGMYAPIKFHMKVSEKFQTNREPIWAVLSEFDSYPKHRKDVKKVKFIGKNMKDFPIWKEYNRFDIPRELELMEMEENRMVIHLRESWTGMKGQWTYDLNEKKGETIVTICEDTITESVIGRFLQVILGRGSHSKYIFTMIEQHLVSKEKPQTAESTSNVSS